MGPQPTGAVVICAHTLDRWEILTRAVAAVRAQTVAPSDLIVVVDGNGELLRRAQAELDATQVVANHGVPGLSGGRLTGAELARAPVLVFLDDDAVPEPQWLASLLAPFDDPDVLGAGGPVLPLWQREPPAWLTPELYWVVGCTWAGAEVSGGRIRGPIGANMAVRADVVTASGGFQAELGRSNRGSGMGGTAEETEFAIRASRRFPDGYWAFAPDATVHHLVPESRMTVRYLVRRCQLEGRSKAIIASLRGPRDALSNERSYATRTIPRAVARDLTAAARGDRAGLSRAAANTAGLLITAGAYARARAQQRLGPDRATA